MRCFLFILLIQLPITLTAQHNPREDYLTFEGAELYYRIRGEGQPLVVISGPGMDGSYFHPSIDPLSKTFRLITYDQRGTGESKGILDTLKLTMDRYVEDLEALRQGLGVEKMHLMGHSYGGLLAMYYALKYPQRLGSLMLVGTGVGDSSSKSQQTTVNERLTPEDREAVGRMTATGALDTKEGWVNLFKVMWKPYVYDQKKVSLIKEAFSDNTSLIRKHVDRSIDEKKLYAQLANLKVPTLLIHGDYDPVPLSASQRTHQVIKGSTLVVLPKCGHFPFMEQPEVFIKTIVEFTQTIKNK